MQFTSRITEKDYYLFNIWFSKSKRLLTRIIIACVIIIFAGYYALTNGFELKRFFMIVLISGSISIILAELVNIYTLKVNVKKIYRNDKALQQETNYQITEKGIMGKTASSTMDLPWEQIFKVAETKDCLYVFLAPNKAFIFSKRHIEPEALKNILVLFRNHLQQKKLKLFKSKP